MKKINIFLGLVFVHLCSGSLFSQLLVQSNPSPNLGGSNYFLDASLFGDPSYGLSSSSGRLLGFPRTDLTVFVFNSATSEGNVAEEQFFDGAIVFNTGTGNTASAGEVGKVVSVKPGFYYFSNPGNPSNVTNGQWLPLGSAETTIGNAVNEANIKLDVAGTYKNVYSYKTSFAADNTKTTYDIVIPSDVYAKIDSFYKVSIV